MYLSFSNSTNPTFSVQDALINFQGSSFEWSPESSGRGSEDQGIQGWKWHWEGCRVNKSRNCTIACQDHALVFESAFTLNNCMVLAALENATLFSDGSFYLTLRYPGFQTTSKPCNLSLRDARMYGDAYGFSMASPSFKDLSRSAQKILSDCFSEYMSTKPASSLLPYCAPTDFASWLHPELICYPDLCVGLSAPWNQDIGGIGVSHSFAPTGHANNYWRNFKTRPFLYSYQPYTLSL